MPELLESDAISNGVRQSEEFERLLEGDKIIKMIEKSEWEINEAWNRWCRIANLGYISQEEIGALQKRCAILQDFSSVLRSRRATDVMLEIENTCVCAFCGGKNPKYKMVEAYCSERCKGKAEGRICPVCEAFMYSPDNAPEMDRYCRKCEEEEWENERDGESKERKEEI